MVVYFAMEEQMFVAIVLGVYSCRVFRIQRSSEVSKLYFLLQQDAYVQQHLFVNRQKYTFGFLVFRAYYGLFFEERTKF
jgi:hypothetical protein